MIRRRLAAMTAAAFLCGYACQIYDESDLEAPPEEEPNLPLTGGRAPSGGAPFVPMSNAGSGGVATAGGMGSRGGGGSGGRGGVTAGASGGMSQTSSGGSDSAPGGDSGSPGGAPDLGAGGEESPGGASDPGGGSPAIGGGGTTGGAETGGASTGGVPIAPELIEDCENGNNQILVNHGRNGYWSTFGEACNLSPPSVPNAMMAAQFMTAVSAGTGTGLKALHFVSEGGDEDSCGVGFDFLISRELYDASDYAGVSFGAQSVTGSQIVSVKVSTAGTDPKFGFCDETAESGSGEQCYDHFFAEVMLDDTWRDYAVSFADLVQEGWGFAPPDGFDPAEIVGIQWVAKPGTANIWIDDVKFVE